MSRLKKFFHGLRIAERAAMSIAMLCLVLVSFTMVVSPPEVAPAVDAVFVCGRILLLVATSGITVWLFLGMSPRCSNAAHIAAVVGFSSFCILSLSLLLFGDGLPRMSPSLPNVVPLGYLAVVSFSCCFRGFRRVLRRLDP